MTVERGEVFGLLGPERRGQDDGRQAAARPGPFEQRRRPRPRRAARRPVDAATDRLPPRAVPLPAVDARPRGAGAALRPGPTCRGADWAAAIDAALELVGLADRAEDLVGTFSKGMQQRLGLGVALLGAPDLVILDEPTSALDPVGRNDVRAIIRDARERGTTVFLNSHLLTEVERVCDRVAIVDHGRVVEEGRLVERPRGPGRPRARGRPGPGGLRHARAAVRTAFVATATGWPPSRSTRAASRTSLRRSSRPAARVHEVDAGRRSLEERFLALLARSRDRHGPRAVITIARLTIREAARRRILWILARPHRRHGGADQLGHRRALPGWPATGARTSSRSGSRCRRS